jgi:hypothetical protein
MTENERKEKLQTGTRYYKLTRLLVPSAGRGYRQDMRAIFGFLRAAVA